MILAEKSNHELQNIDKIKEIISEHSVKPLHCAKTTSLDGITSKGSKFSEFFPIKKSDSFSNISQKSTPKTNRRNSDNQIFEREVFQVSRTSSSGIASDRLSRSSNDQDPVKETIEKDGVPTRTSKDNLLDQLISKFEPSTELKTRRAERSIFSDAETEVSPRSKSNAVFSDNDSQCKSRPRKRNNNSELYKIKDDVIKLNKVLISRMKKSSEKSITSIRDRKLTMLYDQGQSSQKIAEKKYREMVSVRNLNLEKPQPIAKMLQAELDVTKSQVDLLIAREEARTKLLDYLLSKFQDEQNPKREIRKSETSSKKLVLTESTSVNMFQQIQEGNLPGSDNSVLVAIKIPASSTGFGLSLVQRADKCGIIVDSNHKGGDLKAGDRLIEVNGKNVVDMNISQIPGLLKQSSEAKLVVIRETRYRSRRKESILRKGNSKGSTTYV